MGSWLARKARQCLEKRREAEEILEGCEHDEATLRAEWRAQVDAQTRPLPREL